MVSVCRLLTLGLVKKCYLTALHLLYIGKTHTLKKSCFLDTFCFPLHELLAANVAARASV